MFVYIPTDHDTENGLFRPMKIELNKRLLVMQCFTTKLITCCCGRHASGLKIDIYSSYHGHKDIPLCALFNNITSITVLITIVILIVIQLV